jgi:hypothetical protein
MNTFKSNGLRRAGICLAMVAPMIAIAASCGGESDSEKKTGTGGTAGAGGASGGAGGSTGGSGGATGGTGGDTGGTGGTGGPTGGTGGATGGTGGATGGTGGGTGGTTGGTGGTTGGTGGTTGGTGGTTGGTGGSTGGAGGTAMDGGPGGCPSYDKFTLAIHIILDVTWAGSLATEKGVGKVHLWNKATLNANGTALTGEARSCGTLLPDIVLSGAGVIVTGKSKVQIQIPFEAWDAPMIPKFAQTGTLAGWSVGSDVKMEPTVALVGLNMPDPMAPWPASYLDIMGVDHDGDGAMGITGRGKNDATYTYPPTGLGAFGSAPTADKVYIASRTVVQLTGKMTSCEEQAGTANAKFFDNHIIGCHVFNGAECTRTGAGNQTDFIDASRTVYVPTAGTFVAKKIPDNATCADARAALP